MEADAYLIEVTTPKGELRREIYHTKNGADQTVAMYGRAEGGYKTQVFPLFRLPDVGDSVPNTRAEHEG